MLDNKVNIFRTDQDLIRIRLQLLDLSPNFGTLLLAEVPLLQSFEAAERESFEAGLPDGVMARIAPHWSCSAKKIIFAFTMSRWSTVNTTPNLS